ncbi:GNAT family N-acetyltransferase [Candidatus Pacearchaeota archaeon]|nr:GNAT family N-acetyltransferase [Candidatus Pacearchaeota archaeon]
MGLSKEDKIYYSVPRWSCEKVFIENEVGSFIEEFEKLNVDEVILGNIFEEQAKVLEKNGFVVYPKYVYPQLETNSIEDFWNNLKRHKRKFLRKVIRESEDHNIKIVDVCNEEDLKQYFFLEKETMARNNSVALPFEYWKGIFDVVPKNKIIFLLAKKEGNALAGSLCFIDDDKIFVWRGASSNDARSYHVNELLDLYVIEKALDKNIHVIDYGASPIESGGTYRYKSKFSNRDEFLWDAVYPLNGLAKKRYLEIAKDNKKKLKLFRENES